MVVLALTISDNHTADTLLRATGIDAVNPRAARLGLDGTHLASDLLTMIDSIGQDLGRAGWSDLVEWSGGLTAEESARLDARLPGTRALTPGRTTRTTPRDMVTLLRLIWTDHAGPAAACARVRRLMGRQLTRHRLASGFPRPALVAAKSGGLAGVVRNEIGVVSLPDGARYAAAVFTRAAPGGDEAAINAAIGGAAATAVAALRGHPLPY